ncbi:MAG: hypothetical protein ACPGUC_00350 [Gammaproteobacteria bacterium]
MAAAICVPPAEAAEPDYCGYSERFTVVAIDRTQRLDDHDRDILLEGLGKVFDSLEAGERVLMRTIAGRHTDSETLFDACYPGCPDEGLLGSFLGSCSSMRARGDRTRFQQALVSRAKDLLNTDQAHVHSDILLTLAATASTLRDSGRLPTRWTIFSDMLENSPALPWPRVLDASAGDLTDIPASAGMTPRFDGSSVDIFGFGRLHSPGRPALADAQRGHLVSLWRSYFAALGASRVRIGQRLP